MSVTTLYECNRCHAQGEVVAKSEVVGFAVGPESAPPGWLVWREPQVLAGQSVGPPIALCPEHRLEFLEWAGAIVVERDQMPAGMDYGTDCGNCDGPAGAGAVRRVARDGEAQWLCVRCQALPLDETT